MRCGKLSHVGYSLRRVGCQVQALRIETPCIFVRAPLNQLRLISLRVVRAAREQVPDPDRNVKYFVFLLFLSISSLSL